MVNSDTVLKNYLFFLSNLIKKRYDNKKSFQKERIPS